MKIVLVSLIQVALLSSAAHADTYTRMADGYARNFATLDDAHRIMTKGTVLADKEGQLLVVAYKGVVWLCNPLGGGSNGTRCESATAAALFDVK